MATIIGYVRSTAVTEGYSGATNTRRSERTVRSTMALCWMRLIDRHPTAAAAATTTSLLSIMSLPFCNNIRAEKDLMYLFLKLLNLF